ncbi:hypothetical protein CKM354_001029800 [Cercospora kikuchii]|uniref:Fibronectin type-III domain-containing protein n=1 Tax=Cercospora kikuchii TaxID=84275 RepID=A0A9P3CMF5_9PEZI|nr:uncharacterized protein CKM354_001029800 [Cercospora kikuchii]GIZ47199.1 hypothetical protein CKM354_001029800 [Cercospora kikuchii]
MIRPIRGPRIACLLFIALITASLPHVNAQVDQDTAASSASPTADASATVAPVDFPSAVAQEVAVAQELALSNLTDPIPLPTDAPNYAQLSKIAALWPPLQETTGQVLSNASNAATDPTEDRPARLRKRQGGTRVMIVGDSMTHCNEGDFTWRYRIAQWFQSQGVAVDFVGPYQGTIEPELPGPPAPPPLYGSAPIVGPPKTSGGYATAFDSSHFAISGRAAAVVQGLIQEQTAANPTDLMLVMLGFNDLGWFYSDDDGLITSMSNLINNARRSNPNMKFVVSTVIHRTFIGGREDLVRNTDSYNRKLREQVPRWSTASSPVVIAPVREEFDCGPQYNQDCPAAYDGLHPNELGEYQIARAFSRALVSGLGIGSTPIQIPGSIPSRPLPVPQNFQMSASPLGLTATWDKVYGAYEYDVEYRINGGAPFNFSPGQVRTNRWDTRWAIDGWTYDIRIRSSAGNRKGGWSGWLSGTARPQTAAAPGNVAVRAQDSGISVRWTPPAGPYSDSVFRYNVYYWDLDTPCAFLLGAAFEGTSALITGLIPGHRHLVAIETWNAAGAGFPVIARSVVPGRGTPGTPQNLQVNSNDPATVHLTWNAVAGAAGYILARRNVNQQGSQLERFTTTEEGTCSMHGFQFPGAWNYEWAVLAFNGEAESSLSAPRTAPVPQEAILGLREVDHPIQLLNLVALGQTVRRAQEALAKAVMATVKAVWGRDAMVATARNALSVVALAARDA